MYSVCTCIYVYMYSVYVYVHVYLVDAVEDQHYVLMYIVYMLYTVYMPMIGLFVEQGKVTLPCCTQRQCGGCQAVD